MNGFLKDFLKNEWKWLLGLAVAGVVGWNGLSNTVKAVSGATTVLTGKVASLETFKAVQEKQNQFIEKKLENIDDKLDRLLRR